MFQFNVTIYITLTFIDWLDLNLIKQDPNFLIFDWCAKMFVSMILKLTSKKQTMKIRKIKNFWFKKNKIIQFIVQYLVV